MDYAKPLTYRGLNLNSILVDRSEQAAQDRSGKLSGIMVEDFIVGPVQGVGYTEKRSNADGRDASDVYLDSRRLVVQGTVYGENAADAHDRFQELCSVISPTGAYNAEPGAYGYLPLTWFEPTNDPRYDTEEDVDGNVNRWREVFANARPLTIPERRWVRDRTGGIKSKGIGVPFIAYFEAIDPRIYVEPVIEHDLEHAAGTFGGTFLNRGDYPSPLNIQLAFAALATPGTVTITGAGAVTVITIPSSAVTQIIRYNGALRVLTQEEDGQTEVQRQDLLDFTGENENPAIEPTPLDEAEATWSVTTNKALQAGSKLWFYEAYA